MIRNSLLICVAVVALTTGAHASDLPTSKGPPPAPAYAPFSWTGFYIGANGGYGWGSAGDMTLSNNIGVSLPPTAGPKPAGGFGGAQAGYNWQTGMFVLGAEADIQGAAINNNFTRFLPAGGVNLNAKQDIDMFGTVRARGGFAVDHFLIYATGGLAYANVDDRLVLSAGGASATLTKNEIQVGAAVGGGVEYALNANWSIKGEYQYVWLPNSGALSGAVTPPNGGVIRSSPLQDSFQTVRAGVNYRF
jgi:outer membrane immunogenic protein